MAALVAKEVPIKRSPFVREETQRVRTCALCKLPITTEQRPSIQLKSGEEAHMECFFREQDEKEKKKEDGV